MCGQENLEPTAQLGIVVARLLEIRAALRRRELREPLKKRFFRRFGTIHGSIRPLS
jgi:hypothetical protein